MQIHNFPPGIHVLERGWLSANNILFNQGGTTALVDSGYCTHVNQTISLVETVLEGGKLDFLINTHLHSDHCGGNASLQIRYPAIQTFIPPGQAQYVTQWDPVALTFVPTGQLCPKFKFDKTLQAGNLLKLGSKNWEIHAAPGHDPHSLIFFEPETRILISADALWENGFGVVFPELEGNNAFSEVAATFDVIERLNVHTVIPGHGRVFKYTPKVLEHSRQRLDSFVKNPEKHAQHAAKVLLKFKLLEVQRQPLDDFIAWAASTSYLQKINARFFQKIPLKIWLEQLCDQLVIVSAAQLKDGLLVNT